MKPEDDLMDALLKEQARKRDADEQLLKDIESGIDASESPSRNRMPAWLPLSAAAAVALGGAWWHYRGGNAGGVDLAYHEVELPQEEAAAAAPVPEAAERPAEVAPLKRGRAARQEGESEATGALMADMVADQQASRADADGGESRLSTPSDPPVPDVPGADPAAVAVNPKPAMEPMADEVMEIESDSTPAPAGSMTQPSAPVTPAARLSGRALGEEREAQPLAEQKSEDSPALTLRKGKINGGAQRTPVPQPLMPKKLPLPLVEEPLINGGGGGGEGGAILSRDRYDQLVDQPWKSAIEDPLSTFSIDVDTASYTNLRRAIREGRSIQPDAVRIEECINYFDYRYAAPGGDRPFAVHTALATCPWEPDHLLARVAIKGREVAKNARPASNLTFLIDVSGSMQSPDKLQLLKRSMKNLVKSLDERDRVGIVVYAGTEGVVLPPTLLDEDGKKLALSALSKLESGGSTNGGAGIKRAYQMALKHKRDGGVNRVILATDGDFNVGVTGQGELVDMVQKRAAKGVFLTVLGFGTGNLNDALMEKISNDGNGNYFYLDSQKEGKRVLMTKLSGTLVTIAKDVKIQIEFNPGKVKGYRLIGYANRVLRNRDFNDDKIDAGEIGAGHTVTAFYEIIPDGVAMPSTGDVDELRYQRKPAPEQPEVELVDSDDWLTLKLRYKHPEGDKSKLIEKPVKGEPVDLSEADKDFQLAASVAMFGMKLRNFEEMSDFSWKKIAKIGRPSLADDPQEQRSDFIKMLESMDD